jgi:hypothetical protein
MKRLIPLFVCAVLVALLVAQSAPAVTVGVENTQGMGVRISVNTAGVPTQSTTYDKSFVRAKTDATTGSTDWGKVWLQFDLSSVWAAYGQENLVGASLTIWSENGTGRRFSVAGLNDGTWVEDGMGGYMDAETWQASTLSWDNAPGQDASIGTAVDTSVTTLLWTCQSSATDAIVTDFAAAITGITDTNFDQCARYQSIDGAVTAANTNILAFLGADTDGLVTLIGYDHTNSSNQFWWTGTAGTYTDPLFNGELIRSSPTLTLTFVPEPTTIAILGLGGLFLRRRLA